MASKKKLVFAMASSVVGLWSGRSSPARLFVGLGGAAVLDPTAFSFRPFFAFLFLFFIEMTTSDSSLRHTLVQLSKLRQ